MKSWGKLGLLLSGVSLILIAAPAFVVYIAAPSFDLWSWLPRWFFYACLSLFTLGILLSAVFSHRLYLDFFSMRTTKKGLSLGWSLTLLVILLAAFGYLTTRFDKSFDLTEEKINSLSGQTKEILDILDKDLAIRVFYNGGSLSEQSQGTKEKLKNLLSLYKRQSSRVKVFFLDTRKSNALADKYLSDLPDRERKEIFVFADYSGRRVRAEEPPSKADFFMSAPLEFGEEEITSAIIKARKRGQKEILFLVGHGERDLKTEAPGALKLFDQRLKDSGFVLKEWSFVQDGAPKDSPALVMIVGPRRPFLPAEADWLRGYLDKGGRLFLAIDPGEKHSFKAFLKDYGVVFANQFVIAPRDVVQRITGVIGNALTLGLAFDKYHPVTKRFEKRDYAVFAMASSLERSPDAPKNVKVSRLTQAALSVAAPSLQQAPRAVRPEDLKSFTIALDVQKKDLPGKGEDEKEKHKKAGEEEEKKGKEKHSHEAPPAKNSKKNFRLIVFGDSDFLTNQMLNLGVNGDLAINAVASLLGEEELITIRPKRLKGTKITLTLVHKRMLLMLFVFLPILFLAAGFVLWLVRRKA